MLTNYDLTSNEKLRVLVVGARGLLGNACTRALRSDAAFDVYGTYRKISNIQGSSLPLNNQKLLPDILDPASLETVFREVMPNIVINCISLPKDVMKTANASSFVNIYSLVPHMIHELSRKYSARLIQISSDGVFSGATGNYSEEDTPDADDIYGRSKLLGEIVSDSAITIRTSMIGHGLTDSNGLVSWFLNQHNECSAFPNAIFSGFPVTALAEIIRDQIIPNVALSGLYHIASEPISKFEVLKLIQKEYRHVVTLVPDFSVQIDRSLDGSRFAAATSFRPTGWPEMIRDMREDYSMQQLEKKNV